MLSPCHPERSEGSAPGDHCVLRATWSLGTPASLPAGGSALYTAAVKENGGGNGGSGPRYSAMAQARARPSSVEVPRPISSRMTSGSAGGVVEDVGGLGHFDHEGGLAAGEVVGGADAGEDAVDEADGGGLGGDEGAGLGHQHEEGDLADVGGFAGHVGAGDEVKGSTGVRSTESGVLSHRGFARLGSQDFGLRTAEGGVVGHEFFAEGLFDAPGGGRRRWSVPCRWSWSGRQ